MLKEVKEDLNTWKKHPCSSTRRLNTVKTAILSQNDLQISYNPYQNPSWFFFFLSFSLVEIHKLDLNPYGNTREPEEPEQSGKRTKLKDLNLPITKLTNKALVMKIMYWYEDRQKK